MSGKWRAIKSIDVHLNFVDKSQFYADKTEIYEILL